MIKIKALNENGHSEDELDSCDENAQLFNTETREENLEEVYTTFLQLMSKNKEREAKIVLLNLYELIKDLDEDQASPIQKNLKFLTYKNLGNLFNQRIDFFIEALFIDKTDVPLWIKTAKRAYDMFNDYVLARNCLEIGHKLSPKNWVIIDLLIDCYYILNDYRNCVELSIKALQLDKSYLKAHFVLDCLGSLYLDSEQKSLKYFDKSLNKKIISENETEINKLQDYFRLKKNKRKQDFDKKRSFKQVLKLNLTTNSLNEIGVNLLKFYSEIKQKNCFLETEIDIINNSEDSLNQENDESQSNENKTKALNSQNNSQENSKENSQGNSQNASKNNSQSFPFEFVDKRRSSRVQQIQNKTKDLDDNTIFERIFELFPFSKQNSISKQTEKVDNASNKTSLRTLDSENKVITKLVSKFNNLKNSTILDIIKVYLIELSNNVDTISIPNVYKDVYMVYKHHIKLPNLMETRFGENLFLDDVWSMLTSLEIAFNMSDAYFLSDISLILENKLSKEEYFSFVVRLFFVRGSNENNIDFLEMTKQYLGSSDNNICVYNAKHSKITFELIKAQICSQSINILEKLVTEENYDELFEILTPELILNDNETKIVCKAFIQSENYAKGISFFSQRKNLTDDCLNCLIVCFKNVKNYEINKSLVQNIISIAKNKSTISSWVALLSLMIAAPKDIMSENHIYKFIELSHQYLGSKGRCNAGGGSYLLTILDYLINHISFNCDDLILQCFYCLFGYCKKGSTFQNHCNSFVKMSWDNISLIYNYFIPEELPEFDTMYKNNTINGETRDLLVQIIDLIPENMNPKNFMVNLDNYLTTGLPLPQNKNFQSHQITQDIFYLMADFYFKNKEFDKAIHNYKLDICASHHRFDSWAAVALALNSMIDVMIINDSSCYYEPEVIYEHAVQAIRCYSNALRLDKTNTKIWIEFGNFVYNIGSYASKMKKTVLYFDLYGQEKPKISIGNLTKMSEEMFKHVEYCFESSLTTDCEEEMWLHYYVLGKYWEKSNVLKAIQSYELSERLLYLNGAIYPKKISYSPTQLSIEALEVHYRIHAACIKTILSGKRIKYKVLCKMKMHLLAALRSPFATFNRNKTTKNNSSTIDTENILNCISDVVDVVVDRVENRENEVKITIINLCLLGLKRCLSRFNNHYRSLYRLAHYYFAINNLQMAKTILMDTFEDTDILTGCRTTISGLFNERKSNNFFNGIWRIPVDDVERPGSFSNHMYKCVLLLIQVYTGLGDYNFLALTLAVNLSKTPEANKKYLRDAERLGLSKKAFENACIIMLQQLAMQQNIQKRKEKVLEINRVLERLNKMNLFIKESSALIKQCTDFVNSI